ncbi:MAG: hypothetical protein ABIX01_15825 [Chitinophagaceae bacterium]
MNIELLLRQYLYKHKHVVYPGIGKLVFGASAQLPDSLEKGEALPLQDLNFAFNLNEGQDSDFLAFVGAQTGKIKPLASADVESYFMLSKQFINIGKAFVVEGIGSVEKQDNGTFAFTPGYFLPVSEASAAPHKPLKIREIAPPVPKTDHKPVSPAINKKMIFAIIGILAVGLLVWGIYRIAFSKSGTVPATVITKPDTTINAKDSAVVIAPGIPAGNAGTFKAVLDERFSRGAAEARAAKLRTFNHDARVDSVARDRFIIYIPLKDTTVSVDTLQLTKITGKRPRFISIQ